MGSSARASPALNSAAAALSMHNAIFFILCSLISILFAGKLRAALGVECLHAFLEVLRGAKAAIAMPLKLDGDAQARILRVVEKLFRGPLRKRRERPQLIHKRTGRVFQLAVGDAFGCNAPVVGLTPANAARAHHNILRPGYPNHRL